MQFDKKILEFDRIIGPICFTEKLWLEVLFADLVWEKNIVSAKKISWKIRIIRQANKVVF
jgi:hypothetical protein